MTTDAFEIWKPAVGYEGKYEVSSNGRIRSVERWTPAPHGTVRLRQAKIIKPGRGSTGYLNVTLYGHDGTKASCRVNRLVLLAFSGPPPFEGAQSRHLDGNHLNNASANLAWGSALQNMADKQTHGTTARGARQGLSKLTDDAVRTMRRLSAHGLNNKEIADQFGVDVSTARDAIVGNTWKHVA